MTATAPPPAASDPPPLAAPDEGFDFRSFVHAARKVPWNSAVRERLEGQGISLTPARF